MEPNYYLYGGGHVEWAIKMEGLTHTYSDKTRVSFQGQQFQVSPGEKVVILGPNGCGKTTFLLHVIGILEAQQGKLEVLGRSPKKDFNELRKEIGVVLQRVEEQIIGPTVWDDVAFTPRNHGFSPPEVRLMVDQILQEIGIQHLKNKIPHYLSGGERKKVALAGAMVMRPRLLVMDEPFDGLDPKSKEEVVKLLLKFNQENGTTLLLTSHDINLVPAIADTIYVLSQGQFLAKGNVLEIFSQPEILQRANLEAPILVQLFNSLLRRGLRIKQPLNLEDATEQLVRLCGKL